LDRYWPRETTHPDDLNAAFTALAQLVSDLAAEPDPSRGGVLLDHTTLVCFSEFGRTALINNRDGRDHSLTSSALLIGAGVPHNKVVGASSDVGMAPRRVDPVTGAANDAGVALTPTEIIASVMRSAGLDTYALRNEGLPCLIA
jgi:uncharacterized protein (DUF1501 family)